MRWKVKSNRLKRKKRGEPSQSTQREERETEIMRGSFTPCSCSWWGVKKKNKEQLLSVEDRGKRVLGLTEVEERGEWSEKG